MTKILYGLGILALLSSCSSQPKISIKDTKDIPTLENYIKKYPKDKDIQFLKQKLVALQNANKPKTVIKEMPKQVVMRTLTEQEAEEYARIVAANKAEHSKNTVNVLNQLFNSDPSNKEAILLVQNGSNCNMIMRIQGKKFYNMAVPANKESSIVLPLGDYKLTTNLCDLRYTADKQIRKNLVVALRAAK